MEAVPGSEGKGARRKSALLDAAADLFAARGYHAVSIEEIGHAAGISGPGVYRHFASKNDLLLTLCGNAMDFLLAGAQDITARAGTPNSTVADLVALHVDFAVRERAVLAVYLREQHLLPVNQSAVLRRRQREYERFWSDAIAAQSELPDSDVQAAVRIVLSMLNGTAYIKAKVPRARLAHLLHQLAVGALSRLGICLPDPGHRTAPSAPPGPL